MQTTSSSLDSIAPIAANDTVLVLGPGVTITGSVDFTGDVVVHGQVDGDLTGGRVSVSKGGRISGRIVAREIVIDGEAHDASFFADRIVLRSGSFVTGEIYHRELELQAGCMFEGKSRRSAEPLNMPGAQTADA